MVDDGLPGRVLFEVLQELGTLEDLSYHAPGMPRKASHIWDFRMSGGEKGKGRVDLKTATESLSQRA